MVAWAHEGDSKTGLSTKLLESEYIQTPEVVHVGFWSRRHAFYIGLQSTVAETLMNERPVAPSVKAYEESLIE